MPDILAELFNANIPNYETNSNYHAITLALDLCGEQIEAALGHDFLERVSDLEFQRYHIEALAAYKDGFRMAVRLMIA